MTLGIGRAGLRRIPVDDAYRMRVDALEAAIAEDRAAGRRPIAIVATLGTTASTSVDPVGGDRVDRRARGAVAPRRRCVRRGGRPRARACAGRSPAGSGRTRSSSTRTSGCSRRSTPRSCSPAGWIACEPRSASSPSTCARSTGRGPVRDYNEYQPQLGRRFRALKLWILLRWFGLDGLRRRIVHHVELGAAVRRLGRRRSRLGAPRTGPVLDGLLPLAAGPAAPGARTSPRSGPCSTSGTPRSWTQSTGRVRSSCPTPGSRTGSRSAWPWATCGPRIATSRGPGSSSGGRRTAST